MTSLVLNVDRDNDYGEKVGIEGPVIGYEDCYKAALKLISTDPEDSDANALFGAIRHYEELFKKGENVEIAMITGDSDVGPVSDEKIGKQLDSLFAKEGIDDVILVTDGAEDDYIVPLILSRRKIRYVKHVIVRHNQNIESMYYYIVKALQDKGLINKFIIPLGLILLTYGVVSFGFSVYEAVTKAAVLNPGSFAITLVTIVLGSYMVERGFEIGNSIKNMLRSLRDYAQETRVLFLSYIISASLILVGIASSYVITFSSHPTNALDGALIFLSFFVWWLYGAFFSLEAGSSVEMYINRNYNGIFRIVYGLMFTLSVAFILFGMLNYIRYVLSYITFSAAIVSIFFIVLGLIIAMLSSMVHRYFAERGEISGIVPSSKNNTTENK